MGPPRTLSRTPSNPHAYNHRAWGPELPFWRVVMWIRETGETEVWGNRRTFRYKRVGDYKLWTMGHSLASTIILNRKPWCADEQDREKGAREHAPIDAGRPVEAPWPPAPPSGTPSALRRAALRG